VFCPLTQFCLGSALVAVCVLFDLLDGAMARTAGRVTRFGTVLDASCDRIADGVLFGAITWWAFVVAGDRLTGAAALVCLVCAQVISYIKARADAEGLDADGGLVERAEILRVGAVVVVNRASQKLKLELHQQLLKRLYDATSLRPTA